LMLSNQAACGWFWQISYFCQLLLSELAGEINNILLVW
jgi:hypothetical protein